MVKQSFSHETLQAARAAFLFLSQLYAPPRTWTLAVGKRHVTLQGGTQQALDELAKIILSPHGCAVVTKGLQATNHVAVWTPAKGLKKGMPAPIAEVRYGSTAALLWRLKNPVDISHAAKTAGRALQWLDAGGDLEQLFPLPGSIKNGVQVKQVMLDVNPKRFTLPPNFIMDAPANALPKIVSFRKLIETEDFKNTTAILPMALGLSMDGKPVIADLARMPHVIVAGTTGGGKSVGLRSAILSLTESRPPDELGLILIDPKRVELGVFGKLPHLICPVVKDKKLAVRVLQEAVEGMNRRYEEIEASGKHDIESYNKASAKKLQYIVIIIDEFARLMADAKDRTAIEEATDEIAAIGRAAGVHLIMATQTPRVQVVTGVIKSNLPSRISFAVGSEIDSRVILDAGGAETLSGPGHMLYRQAGGKIVHVLGAFVDRDEAEAHVARMTKLPKPEPDLVIDMSAPRPQTLSAAAARISNVTFETPEDRVRYALAGGVALSTTAVTSLAEVTYWQLLRMAKRGVLKMASRAGAETIWRLVP